MYQSLGVFGVEKKLKKKIPLLGCAKALSMHLCVGSLETFNVKDYNQYFNSRLRSEGAALGPGREEVGGLRNGGRQGACCELLLLRRAHAGIAKSPSRNS